MTIPTRDELHGEVNKQFREFFPSAPERLDPDDREQESLVNEWLNIRDIVLNDWTDAVFYDFFPDFGWGNKIDPNNPNHAAYVDYWNDIHDQIKDGTPGRYDWSGPPSAPADTSTAIEGQPTTSDEQGAWAGSEGSAGAGTSRAVAKGEAKLGTLALHPSVVDGTSVLDVDVRVGEQIGIEIPEGAVWVAIEALPYDVRTGEADDTAQRRAYLSYYVPAIEPRGQYVGRSRLQVDPGSWHVTAQLWSTSSGEMFDDTEGDITIEGRQRGTVFSFPPDTPLDIALKVTNVTRVGRTLYRVSFTVTNNSATDTIPAGLPVTATLQSGDAVDGTAQDYTIQDPIRPGTTIESNLTVGGHESGMLTVSALVQLEGRSFESDPLEIDASQVKAAPKPKPRTGRDGGGELSTDDLPTVGPGDIPLPNFANPEEVKEWLDIILDNKAKSAVTAAEILSFFAHHGSKFALFGEFVLAPIGYVLALHSIFSAVITAFGAGLDRERNRGFVYGLMWQTLDMGNIQWEPRGLNSVGLPDDPFHTDEESAAAFYEGVSNGRQKALDPEVKKQLTLAILGTMAHYDLAMTDAATSVMNDIFEQFGHTRTELLNYP